MSSTLEPRLTEKKCELGCGPNECLLRPVARLVGASAALLDSIGETLDIPSQPGFEEYMDRASERLATVCPVYRTALGLSELEDNLDIDST